MYYIILCNLLSLLFVVVCCCNDIQFTNWPSQSLEARRGCSACQRHEAQGPRLAAVTPPRWLRPLRLERTMQLPTPVLVRRLGVVRLEQEDLVLLHAGVVVPLVARRVRRAAADGGVHAVTDERDDLVGNQVRVGHGA